MQKAERKRQNTLRPAAGQLIAGGAALLAALWPAAALAHPGGPLAPHDLWGAWEWAPGLLVGMAAAAVAYARGALRLWRRAGLGRGLPRWRAAAFVGGLLALALALLSPLDPLGETLFSAHMGQHLLLIAVAAPLLVLGAPLIAWAWALPAGGRRKIAPALRRMPALRPAWRALSALWAALALHVAAIWLWHAPLLFEAALEHPLVHDLEHACFLGTALLFWWALLHPAGGARGYGAGLLALFVAGVQNSLLGALLTFAPVPWYPTYTAGRCAWAPCPLGPVSGPQLWGLTPLQDQQLAGLIMWIPAGLVYLGALAGLFAAWLRAAERAARQREGKYVSGAARRHPKAEPDALR